MNEQNLRVVRGLYEEFARGNVPAILDALDPDIVWTNPGPAKHAYFGTFRGREAAAAVFGFIGKELAIEHFAPHTFLANEDRVVVLIDQRATVRSTGRSFQQRCAHVWTLREGRPVDLLDLQDASAIAAALDGVSPSDTR
ncbi:MAG: nuclear transport factor 2 family protein [Polyangiales bacterium]